MEKKLLIISTAWLLVLLAASVYSQPSTTFTWYPDLWSDWGLACHDVSGDNYRDIVVTNPLQDPPQGGHCWFNYGTSNPGYFYQQSSIETDPGWEVKFGQLRSGENKDLALAAGVTGLKIYYNEAGTLTLGQTLPNHVIDLLSWGNANGEGLDDLVGAEYYGSPYFYVYFNDNGTLQEPPQGTNSGAEIDRIELVDLHEIWDYGVCELVLSSWHQIKIYSNNGSGSFSLSQTINVGNYQGQDIADFTTGDINDDGHMDLAVQLFAKICIYLNNGDGAFDSSPDQTIDFPIFPYLREVALGDIPDENGHLDGYPELAYTSVTDLMMCILPNQSFQSSEPFGETPMWSASLGLYETHLNELIFGDLRGKGAVSIAGTGLRTIPPPPVDYGFYIFLDSSDPSPRPVRNFTVEADPNNHPLLQWATNTEDDINEYHVYRAITHYEYMPPDQEFILIAELDHPNNSYVDEDVYVHVPAWNAKIWYTVRAADLAGNESLNSDVIRFLALYHPESVGATQTISGVWQPGSVALAACPNPFNATTAIGFELPEGRFVNLRVYDTAGELVKWLISGWKEAGSHSVVFDGSNLASGLYLYQLSAGSFDAIGKMVLVK